MIKYERICADIAAYIVGPLRRRAAREKKSMSQVMGEILANTFGLKPPPERKSGPRKV